MPANPTAARLLHAVKMAALRAYVQIGAFKTEGSYRRQVWRVMRDLFTGEIDEYAFVDDFESFIDNQFTRAWNAGAREMGVNPNQFTDDDITALADLMSAENDFMLRLADDILQARAGGMEQDAFRAQFGTRADMWANRYNDIVTQARIHFGGKQMLEWIYGDTAEHCEDCSRLSGVVATANEWAAYHLKPQSRDLECSGYNCRCSLQPTDKPPTPGGIP